jgi:hypothetical protein
MFYLKNFLWKKIKLKKGGKMMSKMKGFSLTSIFAVLVLCFIGTSVVSASPGEVPDYKPVADEMIGSNGITWMPKVEYARLVLTVAKPDGTVIEKTFDSGGTPCLNLSDILTGNSCDGSYTYELRVIPNAENRDMRRKPLTQTGYFLVQGGVIVTPGAPKGLDRTQDIVDDDDVIITGHLGVGPGCTEDMFFGLDRIVISGATPKIYFKDTSDGFICPGNDWRILINQDTCGSANFFSIEDTDAGSRILTLEADAPANSLYVNSNGRIGMGTSTPRGPLEVKKTGSDAELFVTRTDGSIIFMNASANNAHVGSITSHPLKLMVGWTWRMRLNTDNSLDMRSGAACTTAGEWRDASSKEYKENIANLTADEAFDTLSGLNPVKFNYKADKTEKEVGFIAEDVPELVATKDRKHMSAMDVVAVLTKVVQEQQKTISELKEKIADLEKK